MTEISLTPKPSASACTCGHDHEADLPRLDARQIPHAIRHGAILGSLTQLQPGQGLVLIAPHDPIPLLNQIAERFDDVSAAYLVRGPEEWQILLRRG